MNGDVSNRMKHMFNKLPSLALTKTKKLAIVGFYIPPKINRGLLFQDLWKRCYHRVKMRMTHEESFDAREPTLLTKELIDMYPSMNGWWMFNR